MKGQIALAILVGITPAAWSETFGSGGSFMFGGSTAAPAPVPAPAIPRPAEVKQSQEIPPLPRPRPLEKPLEAAVPPMLSEVPFQASVAIGSTRCPEAVPHPNARNTPVKVYVNQQTQSVSIVTPDKAQPVKSIVSTGGGLKIPNGELKVPPYCARTPRKERLIVSSITPEMFEGTGCTPLEIRERSSVFNDYHTRTFTDKNGKPIPMPYAIRIVGGIFFHEVPPSYAALLGHNVSGECIRLKPAIAKFLQAQIRKYGAIEVNITEPPEGGAQYCDERMVADAKLRQLPGAPVASTPQPTGTEDVYGGQESFFKRLAKLNPLSIFNQQPRQQPQAPPRPSRPVASNRGG